MAMEQRLIALGAFLAGLVGLMILRAIAIKILSFRKSKFRINDAILSVTRIPSLAWVFCLALIVATAVSPIPDRYAVPINRTLQVVLIFSIIMAADRLSKTLVRRALVRAESSMANSGLIRALISTVFYGVGLLIIFAQLGIRIGPLLAALGVGGLAAALAFKDTLENMFSGIYLLIDRTVEVGDWIKVEAGQEGILQDIGWRTSKLLMTDGDLLIIPNGKLAQSMTTLRKKATPSAERSVAH